MRASLAPAGASADRDPPSIAEAGEAARRRLRTVMRRAPEESPPRPRRRPARSHSVASPGPSTLSRCAGESSRK